MPDTSKMTPEEYAAYTGGMSFPAGKAALEAQAVESKLHAAKADDYVQRFVRHLEDPAIRLVTEKPHDWTCWGDEGKAAILAAVREGIAAKTADAKWFTDDEVSRKVNSAMTSKLADAQRDAAAKGCEKVASKCDEDGCQAVATCTFGSFIYCQKHFDAI